MPKLPRPSLKRRIEGADPVFSLAQKLWDGLSYFWGPITPSSLWAAAVTAAAYFSSWWQWLEPLGITLVAFGAFMIAWLGFAAASYIRAIASSKRLDTSMREEWRGKVSNINPLDREFHTKRIVLSDLANPVTKRVVGKRLIDCELMGPANIALLANSPNSSAINGAEFAGCDFIVARDKSYIMNVIVLEDCNLINCRFFNCTMYIPGEMVQIFHSMGAVFITMTGDPEIDSRPLQGIAAGRPR